MCIYCCKFYPYVLSLPEIVVSDIYLLTKNFLTHEKCFVTLAAALAMCGTAVAQISAGDYMIKGRVGLNTAGVLPYESPFGGKYASSYNLVAFTPQFEYFATDRLSVGFSAGILNAWSRDKADYEQLGKSIDKDGVLGYFVGPSVNYYIPLGNRFYLSFNGFVGYFGMSSWSVYKVGDNKEKGSSCANFGILSVVPMLNYFINDRWMLTLSAGNAALALGGEDGMDTPMYYAGVNWGTPMLGIGFKF